MSEVRVNNLSNENSSGGPTLSGITTFSSSNFFVPPSGDTASRPTSCPSGSLRFNTDSAKLEYFRGDEIGWQEIEAELAEPLGGGTGSNVGLGHRGLFKNSQRAPSTGSYSQQIDFLTISTLGNSQDFGDTSAQRSGNPGLSSRTRAIIGAGYGPSNQLEFVTIASKGDGTDFGNDVGTSNRATGLSNGTRGIFAGSSEVSPGNVIRYITIDSLGNALDFGDLVQGSRSGLGGAASTTRGVFAGGGASDVEYNTIDYVTIASTGNATDFGDLNYSKTSGVGGGSNATRCIWWGGNDTPGYSNVNTISFNTIATTGNSVDFGDVSTNTAGGSAMPDGTRCVMKLGSGDGGNTNTTNIIEYIQFATTGNATDFGDSVLQTYSSSSGSMSTGHGGLG